MNIYFITGHTASGKTDMVFELFKKFFSHNQKTIVINSDAYQIYQDIKLISTQPDFEEFLKENKNFGKSSLKKYFFLYDFLSVERKLSVFEMIHLIKETIRNLRDDNLDNIIITGGSPMYIRLLMDGIEERNSLSLDLIKEISEEYDLNSNKIYQELLSFDENLSKKISLNDKKRVVNFLAHLRSRATEKDKKELKKESFENFIKTIFPTAHINLYKYILYKDRKILYENASKRFDNLIEKNVINEIEVYLKKIKNFTNYESFTSYKTLGIFEIEKFLKNELSFEEMSNKIKQKTRNYIKHQDTWFRNKFNDFERILDINDLILTTN